MPIAAGRVRRAFLYSLCIVYGYFFGLDSGGTIPLIR